LEILDFDLAGLLEDLAATAAVPAQKKGLELLCSLDPDVPARLRGDPGRLRQILNNLAANAVKFTHQGEVVIRVSREEEAEPALPIRLRFSVRDTGIGIPREKIDALFDKFTPADASTTRRYGGTGLGLAISRQLVELMGGAMGVSSEEGRGSEFWFTLPFEASAATLPAALNSSDLTGRRALIVDDSDTSRRILTSRLAAWGMRTVEASGGPAALELLDRATLEGDPFEVALIDMQMPEMDGSELGGRIATDPRHRSTAMVLLTSLGSRGDAQRLLATGFAGLLTKPVRHQELRELIVRSLSHLPPRPDEAAGPSANGAPALEPDIPRFERRGVRILLAEDNITNQQVALAMLRKLGLRADAVADGQEAILALESIPYDLVLMDCQMPVLDGYAAAREIRRHEAATKTADAPRLPIIALTADLAASVRAECLDAGMDDVLAKPVSADRLAELCAHWLPRRGPRTTKNATTTRDAPPDDVMPKAA